MPRIAPLALVPWIGCVAATARGETLVVPSDPYPTPCAAAAAAADGDVIEIDAGSTYDGDVCTWTASGITIRGVGGRPHIRAAGANAGGKGIWVIAGDDVTVEDVELSGATVPDQNGAAIRQEGRNLTVRRSYFHDCENGILTGEDGESHVLIEQCEFARNGFGDGYTHNLYVGHVGRLTFQYNYSHDAKVGHLLKTRAAENRILYNRITGESGTSSYEIDVPNGGLTYVVGNLIEQGPNSENSTILSYRAEGPADQNPSEVLVVASNTFVNDRDGGTFVRAGDVATPIVLRNNVFSGAGTVTDQANALDEGNFVGDPGLVNPAAWDYHLAPGSPCIDAAIDPGEVDEVSLSPLFQYVHPASFEPRPVVGTLDVGAYEFGGGTEGDTGGAGGGPADATGGSDRAGAPGEGGASGPADATGGSDRADSSSEGSTASRGAGEDGCGCRVPPRAVRTAPLGAMGSVLLLALARARRGGNGRRGPLRRRANDGRAIPRTWRSVALLLMLGLLQCTSAGSSEPDAEASAAGSGTSPPLGQSGSSGSPGGTTTPTSNAGAGPFSPNPIFDSLGDHGLLDLGTFTCSPIDGEYPEDCRRMTDYSGFVYDAHHHQMLAFGGGHATTMNDAVVALPLSGSLEWRSLYAPTPCSLMTEDNLDPDLGAWRSGPAGPYPRPLSAHTYDFLGVALEQDEFVLLGRSFTQGTCSSVGNDVHGPIAHFSLADLVWSFSEDPSSVEFSGNMSGTEYDPLTGRFVSLGSAGLSTYDPRARTAQHVADVLPTPSGGDADMGSLGYANQLVYFPPNDTFYFFARGEPVVTFALVLDRTALERSTLDRLTTTGPTSPHEEPGYAYDSRSSILGGGVIDDTFYAFDPATSTWTATRMEGGDPGKQACHAVGYDPVDDVFLFVTEAAYGHRTWAYRHRT